MKHDVPILIITGSNTIRSNTSVNVQILFLEKSKLKTISLPTIISSRICGPRIDTLCLFGHGVTDAAGHVHALMNFLLTKENLQQNLVVPLLKKKWGPYPTIAIVNCKAGTIRKQQVFNISLSN